MKEEIWKPIKNYEGLYEISNLGNVKSLIKIKGKIYKNETLISKWKNNSDYIMVTLFKNNKKENKLVSRLVAEAFIPNFNNYKEINHINENKNDNTIYNLEWCDRKYNCNYGNRNNIIRRKLKNNKNRIGGKNETIKS